MWFGISAKPYSLHDTDKIVERICPAIEYFPFAVDKNMEGNMEPSG